MKNTSNIIGQRFGRLTVIAEGARSAAGKRMWACKCDCGRIKQKCVTGYDLKSGKVQSCGCLYQESNKERRKTHGRTGGRLYRIWASMRQRCNYASGKQYKNYGGRGIGICKDWATFPAFYDWAISTGYSDELTLDRHDPNGNYCPENCRWVDMKTQQNNRRNNRIVSYFGEIFTLSELADFLSIPYATLAWRINHGWKDADFALTPNLNNKNIRRKNV